MTMPRTGSRPLTEEFVGRKLFAIYPNSTILTGEIIAEFVRKLKGWTEFDFTTALNRYRDDPQRLKDDDLLVAPMAQQLIPYHGSNTHKHKEFNYFRSQMLLPDKLTCKCYDLACMKARWDICAFVIEHFTDPDCSESERRQRLVSKLWASWEEKQKRFKDGWASKDGNKLTDRNQDDYTPAYKELTRMYHELYVRVYGDNPPVKQPKPEEPEFDLPI